MAQITAVANVRFRKLYERCEHNELFLDSSVSLDIVPPSARA
ncbi:hypothetical protein Ae168Ps1_5877c [Pseudonocardia sp. Ae168_Ps1]|nr:hypothetical protein Ae168Ps1_5877c [Pseudonocardia sp. Ae168_Ps1]